MKQLSRRSLTIGKRSMLIGTALLLVSGSLGMTRLIGAQSLQDQINALTNENNQVQGQLSALEEEASSYEDVINALAAQINAYQQEINQRQAEGEKLQRQIIEKEAELARQRSVLGDNIKAMYLEGNITTIEMLATSKNLSDFFDKQQYREMTSNNMKVTLDNITALKVELQSKKEEVERIIKQQEQLRTAAAAQKAEQDRLLSMNKSQQSEYNSQIKGNQDRINELKRQQAIENAKLFGGGNGIIGGGGYPWGGAPCVWTGSVDGACPGYEWGFDGPGSWRNWATGGYAYRNCTDWVAYRVRVAGGYAPSGLGNAKTWDDYAPSFGYTVSSTPRVGAAAISNSGYYGHVMYVEAVNGDGSIVISDYNRQGMGKYHISTLSAGSASTLRYVYF